MLKVMEMPLKVIGRVPFMEGLLQLKYWNTNEDFVLSISAPV